jgi:hypothetical protein
MTPDGPSRTRTVEILNEAITATGGPWSDSLARVRNFVDDRHPGFPWEELWPCQIEGARAALRILQESSRAAPAEADRPATLPMTGNASDLTVPRLALLEHLLSLDGNTADRLERALRLYSTLAAFGGDNESAERLLAALTGRTRCEPGAAAA